MIPATLYLLATVAASAVAKTTPVNEDPTDTNNPRLLGKRFKYEELPFKVDTTTGPRGEQFGYNRCNATTEGPNSLCQTLIVNSLDDFCLFGPPEPNSVVGDTESREVVWCTKRGHGSRIIPAGAITGAQFVLTPSYVEVTGFIKQELINIQAGDYGGELDSGGQDGRGNPLGGVCYSTFGGSQLQQSGSWHTFMGGGRFCLKCCNLQAPNAVEICEHRFDRIGCEYNVIAQYRDNYFESCAGEDQDPVGVYTGADGIVSTYKQPPVSAGEITVRPYEPKIPATSECRQFQSQQLFSGQPTVSIPTTTTTSTTTTATTTSTVTRPGTTTSGTTSAPGATQTPAAAFIGRESSNMLVTGAAALVGLSFLF